MAKRTFLPTLVRILKHLCVYVVRYRQNIERGVAPLDISPLLDSLVESCEALIEVIDHPINP